MSEVTAARPQRDVSAEDAPAFLCELEPWHRVFLRNLGDLIFRREPPPVPVTAAPVPVDKDYFIRTGIAPVRFAESYASHIAFVVIIYLICTLPFFNRSPQLRSPFENTKIEYYPVSEYLPPINTAQKAAMKTRHGAPKLAKQEILSVPPNPDNTHQTIITPPKVKLDHDVALPNIVAWTPIPSAQPVAASARSVSQLKVPQFDPQVVGPYRRCLAAQREIAVADHAATVSRRATAVGRSVEVAARPAQHGADGAHGRCAQVGSAGPASQRSWR